MPSLLTDEQLEQTAAQILLPPADVEQLCSPAHKQLHDDLRRGWHAKALMGAHHQIRLARFFDDLRLLDHPIFGRCQLVIDDRLYEEAKRLHGAECWRDPDFRRQVARDNRQMRIRSKARGTTIVRP